MGADKKQNQSLRNKIKVRETLYSATFEQLAEQMLIRYDAVIVGGVLHTMDGQAILHTCVRGNRVSRGGLLSELCAIHDRQAEAEAAQSENESENDGQ